MTDTVLTEALDRAIGPGPAGPDLPTLLHHGHRTVRRRRAGVVATSLVAVIAAASVTLAVQGQGPSTTAPIAPATSGSDDGGAGQLDMTLRGHEQIWDANARRLRAMNAYGFGPDGLIDFPPGVRVLHRVDDALGLEPQESSVAYVVREDGEEVWYLSRTRATGRAQGTGSMVTGRPGVDAPTFEDWIAAQGPA